MNCCTKLLSGVKADGATHLPRRWEHFYYLLNEAFAGREGQDPRLFENGLRDQGRRIGVGLLSVVTGCGLGAGSLVRADLKLHWCRARSLQTVSLALPDRGGRKRRTAEV